MSLDTIPLESQAGVLFGNVLHFFADPLPLLRTARTKLGPNGVVAALEQRGRAREPWVPHPVSPRRLRKLADDATFLIPFWQHPRRGQLDTSAASL